VNPPDQEQAALLAGQKAGDRIDTPGLLLTPLRRKLAGVQGQAAVATARPAALPQVYAPSQIPSSSAPAPKAASRSVRARVAAAPPPEPATDQSPGDRFIIEDAGHPSRAAIASSPHRTAPKWSKPEPVAESAPPSALPSAASPGFYLQVAALSSSANAAALAHRIGQGASVTQAGKFWRVRMGPFSTEALARARLGGLTAKGYGGVKITH
jgi:rare lipoprotein A